MFVHTDFHHCCGFYADFRPALTHSPAASASLSQQHVASALPRPRVSTCRLQTLTKPAPLRLPLSLVAWGPIFCPNVPRGIYLLLLFENIPFPSLSLWHSAIRPPLLAVKPIMVFLNHFPNDGFLQRFHALFTENPIVGPPASDK